MIFQHFFQRQRLDLYTVLVKQELAQRHAVEGILDRTAAQVRTGAIYVQHRRARKNDFQFRIGIVDVFDLTRPSVVFVHFVQKENFPAAFVKLVGQIHQCVCAEP